jgi:lysophospholipase L1-like esterase
MKNHRIPINDLYHIALPLIATQQSGDGCHFREPANEVLGRTVADVIQAYLK